MKVSYAVLIGVFVASCLGGVGYAIHHNSYESGKLDERTQWALKWLARDKADKDAKIAQEKAQRDEELRRKKESEEIVEHAEQERKKTLADVAAADAVAEQLRGTIASIRKQLATSETSRLSANVASRQTAAETASMFADLYEESDRRAGEIAEYADAAASAGAVCEMTYSAMTRSVE
ncbi:TPA: DUF2514 family protein [Citrobacter braakii]|uniref:DUF2514 domain-containing protein n=1 Tax=Citrobacter braakii TaxID=57706 RepID=A0AAD1L1T6_CITBR|nr:hypothetical protein KAM621c_23910 [Citrobacter braakii]HEE0062770.1 DUF2514 family protein [Citrobacter braakii]HEE9823279.1 DUF2514 family protein [Citrobacter braakii]